MSAKSKRILALLNDPWHKKRLLETLNRDTMDAAAPLGKGEMTILKDMESFDQEHDQYMEDLKSGGARGFWLIFSNANAVLCRAASHRGDPRNSPKYLI